MPITVHRHHGPFSPTTCALKPLRYLEDYIKEVTSDFRLLYPNSKYYSPTATFHDNGTTFHGADEIKNMMRHVFGQFDKIVMEPRYLQVVDESDRDKGKHLYTIVAELMVEYYLKGDEEPVKAPRLMVFEIVDGEDGEAYEGLVFRGVYLGWDKGIVRDEMARRENEC